jgi:hypothetical protein
MKFLSGLMVLGLGLGVLFQSAPANAAGPSGWVNIKEIRTFNSDGGAVVKVDGSLPTSCAEKKYFRVTNATLVRAIHASYLAGRPIVVVASDSCANVYSNATEVYF